MILSFCRNIFFFISLSAANKVNSLAFISYLLVNFNAGGIVGFIIVSDEQLTVLHQFSGLTLPLADVADSGRVIDGEDYFGNIFDVYRFIAAVHNYGSSRCTLPDEFATVMADINLFFWYPFPAVRIYCFVVQLNMDFCPKIPLTAYSVNTPT